jgi:ribosomal protein S18 acetylase RimI-like enzyme
LPNERLFDLTIRAAEMNDATALAQLMGELGYETTKSEMQMRMQRIAADERYRTFVAVCDGKVCGMIGTITCPSYEHNDPSGRILALAIFSTMRRLGIGRALVATAENDFANRGIKRVALNTKLAREDAHKFYESLGYERNGWRFVKQLSVSDWCDHRRAHGTKILRFSIPATVVPSTVEFSWTW